MPTRKPCMECGTRAKWGARQRCRTCFLRHAPADQQTEACEQRRIMVPDELAPARVPREAWPPGTRWCYGCRSFRDLEDFSEGGSRCRPCLSSQGHLSHVQREYGLSPEDHAELMRRQDGRCAICRNLPRSERLAVDHDHKTGDVRGLLCSRCNHGLLGSARDALWMLESAVAYLQAPPASGRWAPPKAIREPPRRPEGDGQPLGGTHAPGALSADDAYRFSGSRGDQVIYLRRDALLPPWAAEADREAVSASLQAARTARDAGGD